MSRQCLRQITVTIVRGVKRYKRTWCTKGSRH